MDPIMELAGEFGGKIGSFLGNVTGVIGFAGDISDPLRRRYPRPAPAVRRFISGTKGEDSAWRELKRP